MRPARVEIHESVEISASADEVWELISDCAGMLRWWLSADDGGRQGPTLIACTLVGEPEGVPRKRRMQLDNGAIVEEEIFYQNNETRRIHYTKADDQDIKSYVASTYVDERGPTTWTVHVSSSFDAVSPLNPASAAARFKAVYTAMFNGYQHYFAGTHPATSP
jgi:uncharacterized protein YndB with AHSA1/START domain